MGIEIEAVGTTRANESVQVTSKASNTIIAIRFNEGEVVERGAVLVEMDDAEAQAASGRGAGGARAQPQPIRPRLAISRRARRVSAADLEQVEATLKADQARVAAAQARVDDTVIRAAFKGRTGFRQVSVGSLVKPGTQITTLDDTSGHQARLHGARDLPVPAAPRLAGQGLGHGAAGTRRSGRRHEHRVARRSRSRARSSCERSCRIRTACCGRACS